MKSSSIQLRQFTEQLGYLIDVSCIIDRNGDDNSFAQSDKEIIYVFDTNVIQMFLEPYKNPQFCEVFHSRIWGGESESDLDVNAQACLLAAEYLLSGKLPGQRNGIWHMTRDHKAEIDAQESYLRGHIADNVARMRSEPNFRQQVLENVAQLTEALDFSTTENTTVFNAKVISADRRASWLNELKGLTGRQFRQRASGIRSREVCRLLARDDVAEPANQLFRYRSGEIAGRFKEFEAALNLDGNEQQEAQTEVAHWRNILADVLSRHPANLKTREGFRADCRALGLISWAGRQAKYRDRRFVLVTGDAVMLEAFRVRHGQNPQSAPYFIRPITHFVPLFNPVSARSTLASQQYAFLKLRQVLEFLLISINLHLLVDAERDTRLRARDAFVQHVQQQINVAVELVSAAFPQANDIVWLRSKMNELELLVLELRPIEKLMLEAFPNLVAPRLKQERVRFEQAVGNEGEALLVAIERRLHAASQIGAQFSLQTTPDAIARLLEAFHSRQGVLERRATIHVYLRFSSINPNETQDATFARLQELSRAALYAELEPLKTHPAKLFALASLLAFRLTSWREAARYSSLAAAASLERTKYVERLNEAPPEHYEYSYLMAAAYRFRLACLEPTTGYVYSDLWGEWLRIADNVLTECINYHRSKHQLTRLMRAQCERAAIHVSYCEWFAFGKLADHNIYVDPEKRALASFSIVVTELRNCEDMLPDAKRHSVEVDKGVASGQSQSVLEAVRRHFRVNIYAAILTARRLKELWPNLQKAIDTSLAFLPEVQADEDWINEPLITPVYTSAFRGDTKALNELEGKLSLPLDKVVLTGLRHMTEMRPSIKE